MSKIKKFLTLFFVFCLIVSFGHSIIAQEKQEAAFDPEKTFFVTQLKEDFLILRNALEEGHGGLYRYTSKEELDKQFEDILGSLNQPMTEMELYRKLLPLVANINDGLSSLNPSRAYNKYLGDKPIFFPFNLRFIDKRVYLFRNYSDVGHDRFS